MAGADSAPAEPPSVSPAAEQGPSASREPRVAPVPSARLTGQVRGWGRGSSEGLVPLPGQPASVSPAEVGGTARVAMGLLLSITPPASAQRAAMVMGTRALTPAPAGCPGAELGWWEHGRQQDRKPLLLGWPCLTSWHTASARALRMRRLELRPPLAGISQTQLCPGCQVPPYTSPWSLGGPAGGVHPLSACVPAPCSAGSRGPAPWVVVSLCAAQAGPAAASCRPAPHGGGSGWGNGVLC